MIDNFILYIYIFIYVVCVCSSRHPVGGVTRDERDWWGHFVGLYLAPPLKTLVASEVAAGVHFNLRP